MEAVLERNLGFIGYPNYSVDTNGNVWSNHSGNWKRLKLNIDNSGYYRVCLTKENDKKWFLVHRLVGLSFVANPNNKHFIDHINTIRTDNRVSNIKWVTRIENNNNPITRKRMSDAKKGKQLPIETRRKLLESLIGRKVSDDTKLKISKSNPNRKYILQYSLDGKFINEFSSIHDAKSVIGDNYKHITECCKGKRKTAGGYIWRYKKEDD